jgi:hypothetical protein
MKRPTIMFDTLVNFAKAVIISMIVLMLADYFALPFFAEAGGA